MKEGEEKSCEEHSESDVAVNERNGSRRLLSKLKFEKKGTEKRYP